MSIWNLPQNFCCAGEKVLMQKCKVFGYAQIVQHNRISEWQKTVDQEMKGKVLTFWKRWFSTVVELQSIWHVKSVGQNAFFSFFFTIFKRKRGGVSIFHFALYYAVFLLDQVLIIKITTQESGLFFLFFITSSIYRFSQKKRIGLIIENKRWE